MGKMPAVLERVSIWLAECQASAHCVGVVGMFSHLTRLMASVAWPDWFMLHGRMVRPESLPRVRTAHDKGVS